MKVYPPILKTKHISKNKCSVLMSLHSMSLVHKQHKLFFFWLKIGQKLLDSLAETWDFFFCDVLTMLQAIFHPVQVQSSHPVWNNWSDISYNSGVCVFMASQGKEPSVRQLALLHFRNTITLNVKLEEALSRPRARVPPSIVQMLLVLQVHRSCERSSHTVMSCTQRL